MSENINRAFMYGESVFTTMRMVDGVVRDWDYHFDRLKEGVGFVFGPFTDGEDWAFYFKNRLEDRLASENGNCIIRLAIFREGGRGLLPSGLMSVDQLKISLIVTQSEFIAADERMFNLRTCPASLKPEWWPSFLKAGNYLETILAQKIYLKPGDDDLLFLSPSNTLLESSVANIFVVRHNRLFTPPAGPNVLAGIMRRRVLEIATEFFETVSESASTIEQVYKADAVFGTNSVRGPYLVGRIDDQEYTYSQDFREKFEKLKRRLMT